jgi:FKBP-type peptidyl-prolyl cis-trans isomerase
MPSGLRMEDVTVGSGAATDRGSTVWVRWRGTLNRGDQFGANSAQDEPHDTGGHNREDDGHDSVNVRLPRWI